MAGEGIFLKWKSKQLAKLYDQLVFQAAVFVFKISHKNTLYTEDRLIKHPQCTPEMDNNFWTDRTVTKRRTRRIQQSHSTLSEQTS